MAKKKKTKRRTKPIVVGHLEKVSSGIFDKYKKQITDMIKGRHGVYALYKGNNLYYIGLASNLKSRIKMHMENKHKGRWTHFSLYIFKKQNYIRELEALLLRIAYPEGNKQKGKLKGSYDLKPTLRQKVKAQQNSELDDLFKGHRATKTKKKTASKKRSSTRKLNCPLRGVFKGGKIIYASYKGKDYKAWVHSNGKIKMIPSGELYNSPSSAGKAIITKGAVNGWHFWKYKDKSGKLRKLADLRK